MVFLPESALSVTSEWLTEALAESGILPDAVVTSFRGEAVGQQEGYTGALARFEISYSRTGEGAPSSLIAKFSPPDPDLIFSLREVRFYEEIAAGGDLPVPAFYYGKADTESGASVLLLEDLSRMRSADLSVGCTPEEAEIGVRALARIHLHWWDDPTLEGKDWLFSFSDGAFGEWWDQYPDQVDALLPEMLIPGSLMELGDRLAEDMPLVIDRVESSPVTVIHRDIHVDNLLFGSAPDDPPAILLDWQLAGRGKGISDVAYLLISSLPPPDRRQSERRIVETYHRLLIESGVQGYGLDQCWADYIVSAAGKLFITVAATVLLDNTSPHRRAWRTADLKRLIAFTEDHQPHQVLDQAN